MKLFATLRTTSCVPFTQRNLLAVLAQYPFTLFLSFVRIAYQAAILHYVKGLDVHGRPEPRAYNPLLENELVNARNPVQPKDKGTSVEGGGIGWQSEGWMEKYARIVVSDFLQRRSKEMGIQIKLVFADPFIGDVVFPREGHSVSSDAAKSLKCIVRSPRSFLVILVAPSAWHALLVGQYSERLFTVSNDEVFLEVFASHQRAMRSNDVYSRLLQQLRLLFTPHLLLQPPASMTAVTHPLDGGSLERAFVNCFVISVFYLLLLIERFIFIIFKARFVVGDEPWKMWKRSSSTFLERPKGFGVASDVPL